MRLCRRILTLASYRDWERNGSVLVLECAVVIVADGGEDERREHLRSTLPGEWSVDLNGAILMAAESRGKDIRIELSEADHTRGVERIVDLRLAGEITAQHTFAERRAGLDAQKCDLAIEKRACAVAIRSRARGGSHSICAPPRSSRAGTTSQGMSSQPKKTAGAQVAQR